MPRRSDASLDRRFEMIEQRVAELRGDLNGEFWWELFDLSKRVLALEKCCKKPQTVRKSNKNCVSMGVHGVSKNMNLSNTRVPAATYTH